VERLDHPAFRDAPAQRGRADMSTADRYTPAGAAVQETSAAEHEGAIHSRRHVSRIPRSYRNSLFRHASGPAPHHRATNAVQLEHLLHGAKSPTHAPGKHDERGQPQHQQKHKQQQPQDQNQHQRRRQKQRPSPEHPQRGPHRPVRTLRWHVAHAARDLPTAQTGALSRWPDQREGNHGDSRDQNRDEQRPGAMRKRVLALGRINTAGRTELQTVAARTHDQPLVYVDAMREALIRQRCAGHDPHAVTEDVLKARTLALDYTKTGYDDLQGFLRDFLRFSAGSGATGALTPLCAFHDLRTSSPTLRQRSLSQHNALGMSRWRVADGCATGAIAPENESRRGTSHAQAFDNDSSAAAGVPRGSGSGPAS
jgi:hypothetical protein